MSEKLKTIIWENSSNIPRLTQAGVDELASAILQWVEDEVASIEVEATDDSEAIGFLHCRQLMLDKLGGKNE